MAPKPNAVEAKAQAVGRQYAKEQAKEQASQAVSSAKTGIKEVGLYIRQNPLAIKIVSFVMAILLMIFSIIGLINIFDTIFKPGVFLVNVYNLFFACIILIMEGKEEWCLGNQTKLYTSAPFLATPFGRGWFTIYIGTMTWIAADEFNSELWLWMYYLLGFGFVASGIIMIQQLICPSACCGQVEEGDNSGGGARNNGNMGADAPSPEGRFAHQEFQDENAV